MSTATYYERERAFYRQRADLDFILSHPDFKAPDHPYVDQLKTMSKFAIFGLIDTSNGVLSAQTNVFVDTVVIAPVIQGDLRTGTVSIADDLLKNGKSDEQYDFSALSKASGNCHASDDNLCPVISLAPYMNDRHPLVTGTTLAHELDHAYWWLRRKSKYKHINLESDEGVAAQEISANRLEQQIFFAHLPAMYDKEYGNISLSYADKDFGRIFRPRGLDKVRKSVRVVAFINFMLDTLGADVGIRPTADVVEALKAQELM